MDARTRRRIDSLRRLANHPHTEGPLRKAALAKIIDLEAIRAARVEQSVPVQPVAFARRVGSDQWTNPWGDFGRGSTWEVNVAGGEVLIFRVTVTTGTNGMPW